MPGSTDDNISEAKRWVSFYESFVESVRDGYDMCLHEYTNDLSCREQLERYRDRADVKAIWDRVNSADSVFQSILLPTKCSIYGNSPRSHFWFWGYPDGSPDLIADLKALAAI